MDVPVGFFFTSGVGLYVVYRLRNAKTPIRAAFDIGSGATKLTVGKVCNGELEVLFSEQQAILVGQSLWGSEGNRIPRDIADKVRDQLVKYKRIALDLGATEFACVCTAAFREAENGAFLLNKLGGALGVHLQIISQELEGLLGFQTAVAVSGQPRENVISWDSGGSSFQIVGEHGGRMNVLEGPVGSLKVMKLLVTKVQRRDYTKVVTPNPVQPAEASALIELLMAKYLPDKPAWLCEKMSQGSTVVGYGGETCLFRYVFYINRTHIITSEQIPGLLNFACGKTDAEMQLSQPQILVPKLCLMAAVMRKYGFTTVMDHESNGNTEGMFFNSELWHD